MIELNVIEYSAKFIPKTINTQGIAILKNYDEYSYQSVINYYYNELVTNPNVDNSFISNVLPEMLTDSFIFKNTSLFGISVDDYIKSHDEIEIKSTSTTVNSKKSDDTPKVYSSSSEYAREMSSSNMTPCQPIKNNDTPTIYHSAAQYEQKHEDQERKKGSPTNMKIILAIAIALLVGIILLVAHRIAIK